MIRLLVFISATVVLLYVSRASLRSFRLHGFHRFFAWEAILILTLLNLEYWFTNPFRFHQIISWLLLIVSLFLVIHGVRLLHVIGKPDRQRTDAALIGFEKTSRLVTIGAYRFIRHPLYSSLLFLTWGVFFKHPSWAGGLTALISTIFLVATAKSEEKENLTYFGSEYAEYIKQTKMFLPYIF